MKRIYVIAYCFLTGLFLAYGVMSFFIGCTRDDVAFYILGGLCLFVSISTVYQLIQEKSIQYLKDENKSLLRNYEHSQSLITMLVNQRDETMKKLSDTIQHLDAAQSTIDSANERLQALQSTDKEEDADRWEEAF